MFKYSTTTAGATRALIAATVLWATTSTSHAQTQSAEGAVAVDEYAAADEFSLANSADQVVSQTAAYRGASTGVESCCSGACGCCRDVCCATLEEVEIDKYCWNVSCEKICVPGITFPWEGCGWSFFAKDKTGECCDQCTGDGACCRAYKPARCGKVVCVHTPEKHDYTCNGCECKWELRRVCSGCGRNGCSDLNCGAKVSRAANPSGPKSTLAATKIQRVAASQDQPHSPVDAVEVSSKEGPARQQQPWWRKLRLLHRN